MSQGTQICVYEARHHYNERGAGFEACSPFAYYRIVCYSIGTKALNLYRYYC